MQAALGRVGKSLGSVKAQLAGLVAVGALTEMTRRTLAYADAVAKTADRVGVGTTALQELRYAAERGGVASGALDMALQRLTRRVAEAAKGKGELKNILEQYNIAATDAEGNTRATEAVLYDLADAVQRAGNDSEQLRIAFKAFDSQGAALVGILKNGAAGMEELRGKARALGVTLEEDALRQAEATSDALADLADVAKTQTRESFLAAAPAIERAAKAATELLVDLDWHQWGLDVGAAIESIEQSLGPLAELFGSILSDVNEIADLGRMNTLIQAAGITGDLSFYERLSMLFSDPEDIRKLIGQRNPELLRQLGYPVPGEEVTLGSAESPAVRIVKTATRPALLPGADATQPAEDVYAERRRLDQEYALFRVTLEEGMAQRIAAIEERAALQRRELLTLGLQHTQTVTADAAGLFRQLYEDSGGAAKKYWEAYKALSIAETVVATASSIMGIWQSFSRYGPPGVAAAAALSATVGAIGATKIALIAKQNPAQPFADGGIVTGPVTGLVGEAGDEAIIPLDKLPEVVGKLRAAGGGTVVEVTNNVRVEGGMGQGDVAALRQAVGAWTNQGIRAALANDKGVRAGIRRLR